MAALEKDFPNETHVHETTRPLPRGARGGDGSHVVHDSTQWGCGSATPPITYVLQHHRAPGFEQTLRYDRVAKA